jgi:hypothetical protein
MPQVAQVLGAVQVASTQVCSWGGWVVSSGCVTVGLVAGPLDGVWLGTGSSPHAASKQITQSKANRIANFFMQNTLSVIVHQTKAVLVSYYKPIVSQLF